MPSLEEQVVAALEVADRPLDDDALAVLLGVRRQAINQLCRRLATTGRIDRQPAQGGKIVNRLVGGVAVEAGEFPPASGPAEKEPLLSEDELKAAVRDHLEATGLHRVDIDAVGPQGRFLIEAKGEVALQPQQVNYFVGALGELIQRMEKLPSHGAC